ncbi:hypothetical protein FACUT_3741 [Fusarium acutatum]|uniref:Uncharacterized protein n=1 Tax=Fusarium acutatum TaxID=78861 RepID=A0A8H4NPZ2_9HYPO|nr:hypothetical protein FACUT_3741 [Fusarium acutatum]
MPSSNVEGLLSAPEQQIRAVLGALCQDEDTRSRALDHYNNLQATPEVSDGRKRKAEDEISDEKACRYHHGFMHPDEDADVWAEHGDSLADVETEEY